MTNFSQISHFLLHFFTAFAHTKHDLKKEQLAKIIYTLQRSFSLLDSETNIPLYNTGETKPHSSVARSVLFLLDPFPSVMCVCAL